MIQNLKHTSIYKIFNINNLLEEIKGFNKKYWFLYNSFGVLPIGNTFLIETKMVKKEDKKVFEKYSLLVPGLVFTGDLYGFESFMKKIGFNNIYEYWVNIEEDFGLMVETKKIKKQIKLLENYAK